MRWLARASIRNPVVVHMLIAALLLVGTYSLIKLPRELMSEISFNWVFVRIDLPNAAPQEIEQMISQPVEEALEKVDGVSSISVRAKEGYSFFSVKFEQLSDQEFNRAFTDLKDELEGVALPEDSKDPFVLNFSSQDFVPMVSLVVYGDLPAEEMFDVAERIEDEVSSLPGISKIEVGGVRERRVRVDVDPDALAAYGLRLDGLSAALSAGNLNIPGGTVAVGPSEYILRTVGQFRSIDDIAQVVVGVGPGGGLVQLGDVADVRDTRADPTVLSRFEGQQAVSLAISKKAGGNNLQLVAAIDEIARVWDERLGDRATVSLTGDTSIQIGNMLGDLQTNALFGMALVILVLWIFLGLRNALITALGIPLAFLATFIFMLISGESLNGNSLFGLVLVLGIIVDDAIVLVENTARHRGMGKERFEAVVDGVAEVSVPVIAAIATTIAAFLPLMLMPGLMGKFLRIIPVVVCLALVASLVEALVSMPCHVYEWGEQDPKKLERRAAWFDRFVDPYARLLRRLVNRRLPRFGEASFGARSALRVAGWGLFGLPVFAVGAAFGAGIAYRVAGADGAPKGALAGLLATAATVLLLSAIARRDLIGRYGLQIANLGGLSFTAVLAVAAVPLGLAAVFGPRGALVGGLVLGAVALVGGLALLFRGSPGRALRRLWEAMAHLRWTLFAAVYLGMVPLAGIIAASVDLDLFGGDEIPQFFVRVRMPEGTALQQTDAIIREMERVTRAQIPPGDLKTITANTGLLQTDDEWFIKPSVGQLIVDLPLRKERTQELGAIMADLRDVLRRVPGPASLEIKPTNSGPPAGADVELKVQGPDLDRLVELSEAVRAEMLRVPGVEDVRSDWVLGKTELRVAVNPQQAALLGVDERSVGLALRQAFEGTEATRYQDADEDVPVIVRYADRFRQDLSWIERTLVPTGDGGTVAFGDVATVTSTAGIDAIRRYKGQRTISLSGTVDKAQTTSVSATQAVQARLADFSERFPGYRIDYSGEFEEFQKSLEALLYLGVFGLLCVFMILGAQFRSFLQPLIIIGFTFPGALLGSAIALLVTGTPLSMLTMYGVVALLGIVVNDSLVFISFINDERDRGTPVAEAIVAAGKVRLRPIVLTTVTTVFGLGPMALGLGGKSEAWGPLATTIVFGLLVATATTLLIIPPVYRCFAELTEIAGSAWRRAPPQDAPASPFDGLPAPA